MALYRQFFFGVVIIAIAAILFSGVTNGWQFGSIADWVSGGATAIGVWVALWTAEQASNEAKSALVEARHIQQNERARALYREHYVAYAAALNAAHIATHRIRSTRDAVDASGGIQRMSALLLVRMVEADKDLMSSVNLMLLDPTTAHQMTSLKGALSSTIDALMRIVEVNPADYTEVRLENDACLQNLKGLEEAVVKLQHNMLEFANEGIAEIAAGFGLPPSEFKAPS